MKAASYWDKYFSIATKAMQGKFKGIRIEIVSMKKIASIVYFNRLTLLIWPFNQTTTKEFVFAGFSLLVGLAVRVCVILHGVYRVSRFAVGPISPCVVHPVRAGGLANRSTDRR